MDPAGPRGPRSRAARFSDILKLNGKALWVARWHAAHAPLLCDHADYADCFSAQECANYVANAGYAST
jgi:hypothetical protein